MGALNYISYAVFAVIFLSIGFLLFSEYQRGTAERDFIAKAGELADRIEGLGNLSIGTTLYFQVHVPAGCTLSFVDNSVVVRIRNWMENFQIGIPVDGPSLNSGNFSLKLERTTAGVRVSE